jgi:hypothetical protein
LEVDWFFTVEEDPRGLCYIAEGDDGSTLIAGTGQHDCVFIADTPELLLEQVEKVRGYIGEGIISRPITWASVGLCFRMLIYRNKMRLLMGGKGWVASSITYTPSLKSKLICDPQTTVVVAEYNGEMLTNQQAIIVGSSLEDLFKNLSMCEVDVDKYKDIHNLKFVVYPLLKFMDGETLYYHGNTHNVQEALMSNYGFLTEVLGGDEEDKLIAKIKDEQNEN